VISVLVVEDAQGNVPPISTTVWCIINLAFQYFVIMLGIFVVDTVASMMGDHQKLRSIAMLFENLRCTVQFCPMLSVLFIGTRMRALQITDQLGAPQGWAQEAMLVATFAVLFQALALVALYFFGGDKVSVDEDGNPLMQVKDPFRPQDSHPSILEWLLKIQRWGCMVAIYGGSLVVILSVFRITPETANGCNGWWMHCPKYWPA